MGGGVRARLGLALCALGFAYPAVAQDQHPSALSTFPLGGSRGSICSAQTTDSDPALKTMFDRGYAVVCRDAALPVARLYALRRQGDDPAARLAAARAAKVECGAPHEAKVEDIGAVQVADCKPKDADIAYRVYSWSNGRTTYVAEGLAGYDSALTIGLRTLVTDRQVKGDVMVATTEAGDPAAFARVQAGTLSTSEALAEGYRRNNSGDYAEASEFFVTLMGRGGMAGDPDEQNEFLVNRALQQSNLGNFDVADALLRQAQALPTDNPVQLRLRRNFKALHLLNQRKLDEAQAELERPMIAMAVAPPAVGAEIDRATATAINANTRSASRFGDENELTPAERAQVLDAQARQLHGTVRRLQGDLDGADADLQQAALAIGGVRGGRVRSTARLLAQTMAEQARVAEDRGDLARGEALLRQSLALLDQQYPASVASRAGEARLAGYLARHGKSEEALKLFRGVVAASTQDGAGAATSAMLAPYFALLAEQIPSHPELVNDFFLASETMVRPGVANTQAVLARELSAGTGDAARLFRQSVTLARDVERARVELAALQATPNPQPSDQMHIAATQARLDQLSQDQTATQARLASFAQYRALSNQALTLADLQKSLRADEGYFKLTVIEDVVYAIYVGKAEATAYRTGIAASALDSDVNHLRDTITVVENGQQATYPFDLKLARSIYVALMQPVEGQIAKLKDLIFEPDGGMLRLPANLLPTDQASVDAYYDRLKKPGADEFDFRGVSWLGRKVGVTTAVSAHAFRDVRASPPSAAKEQYLGFGQNAPVSPFATLAMSRAPVMEGAVDCNYPLAAWNHPIAANELFTAEGIVGKNGAEVISGRDFSDTTVIGKKDLDQYRVLHFATHGLIGGPYPGCPAQPALLTSFGTGDSDGLLTFREIYDLHVDADLVILSACDTAAAASVAATRAAGITSGGGFALDGLVRAFVGAGARSVVASHWPVPNDFSATERLISGLFQAPPGTSVAEALRVAEVKLMDQPETSHPYYWAAFAIVGDGTRPVLRSTVTTASAAQ
jgi:CHAT domain-containing protein